MISGLTAAADADSEIGGFHAEIGVDIEMEHP